jgi:hypothetical protein
MSAVSVRTIDSIDELSQLDLFSLEQPLLIKGAIDDWPAMSWTIESLRQHKMADASVPASFFPLKPSEPHQIAWETDQIRIDVILREFLDWMIDGDGDQRSTITNLQQFKHKDFWGYQLIVFILITIFNDVVVVVV